MRSKDLRQSLRDILDNIARIESYTGDMDAAAFRADARTSDAVERCLQRISEAAVRLGEDGPRLMPAMPWPDIRGIGNHLRHAYDVVSSAIVWNVVQRDLPALKQACESALTTAEPGGGDPQ